MAGILQMQSKMQFLEWKCIFSEIWSMTVPEGATDTK